MPCFRCSVGAHGGDPMIERGGTAGPPDVVATSLDPLESTPQSVPRAAPQHGPGWPLTDQPEGFRLVSEPNTGRKRPVGRHRAKSPPTEREMKFRKCGAQNSLCGIHFRHRTWHHERGQVLAAIDHSGIGGRRFWRFKSCGEEPVVFRDPEDRTRFKVGCKRCHDRFCLPCSQDRARLIIANLKEQLPEGPTRFVTLTLKHSDQSLRAQLDRLYDCFTLLRRRKFWRDLVEGGAAFLEVKLARSDNRWHPHLHVLCRGKYIPQAVLADAWLEITGDSHIVDVRMVKDPGQVYRYLGHYVTKGCSKQLYRDRDRLAEAIHALSGRKILATFGSFAKLHLLKPPNPDVWEELGTLAEIRQRATEGNPLALQALEAIAAPWHVQPPTEVPPDE